MRGLASAAFLAILASSWVGTAAAQQGGVLAILAPGAGGAVPSDFLIRNRGSFAQAGVETAVATSAGEASSIAAAEGRRGRRVVLVGMSRGAFTVAGALASGAPVAGAVFVSANYQGVISQLGSPAALPPTLVVHHRADACRFTTPAAVGPFVAWSRGRARVQWIANSGNPVPNPCGPFGAHGFYTDDGSAVSAIVAFIRSR